MPYETIAYFALGIIWLGWIIYDDGELTVGCLLTGIIFLMIWPLIFFAWLCMKVGERNWLKIVLWRK